MSFNYPMRCFGCSVIAVAVLLGGCATRQKVTSTTAEQREQGWLTHQISASAINRWEVSGRASVKSPEQSGSVGILWERSPTDFSIYMSGPIGQTLAHLEGQGQHERNQHVTLNIPGQQPATSSSVEQLLYEQTGWLLPFQSLDSWIRGIPSMETRYTYMLNEQGLLAELYQNGWKVSYSRYRMTQGIALPEKIRAERDDTLVIFFIRKWTLSDRDSS